MSGEPVDHPTPQLSLLLKSVLDLMVAMAWAGWDRLRASQDERRACAIERQRPVRRLETRRGMGPQRPGGGFPAAVVSGPLSLPGKGPPGCPALGGGRALWV